LLTKFKEMFKIAFAKYECTNQTTTYPGAAYTTITQSPSTVNNASTTTTPLTSTNCDGIPLFYCWSHGLGCNRNHTSHTCENKLALATKMKPLSPNKWVAVNV
jgi:hypothetical protein